MDDSILNAGQAAEFLGISEKTLFKLLREEHIPARKIGREWRFSKKALTEWLACGDSLDYISRSDYYRVSEDKEGNISELFKLVESKIDILRANSNINQILRLEKDVYIPESVTLRVSYKQQRDLEKLEFKFYWPMRDEYRDLSYGGNET
ncbi:MAG: hypothetical protein PWR08_1253 [Thermoanaerobacterium sp.]|jgi:DNA binding domain, excisionase family|uniref:helix-turn-helix domain-containing protein n=1 Tax=Thermoanaerobacterium thermosaccharolyticum TaxID=1517 RepID=UPI002655C456|nr:hypothetical protein [Thermoanaerobacterium sp.]MDN5317128.1 hypothetical protein [Thermoanaerobacterium sp.]WHE06478.1 helix-turn-helix domain-containing protein [Thermoanaerobacterium thermosaccharolyticum]